MPEDEYEEVVYVRGQDHELVRSSSSAGMPACVSIFDVMLSWSRAVAEGFVWLLSQEPTLTLEECWISTDQALMATYKQDGVKLGVRYAKLYVDKTTLDVSLCDAPRGVSSANSLAQASNLVHGVPMGFGIPRIEWVDPDGRGWWGDIPEDGWDDAISSCKEVIVYPQQQKRLD